MLRTSSYKWMEEEILEGIICAGAERSGVWLVRSQQPFDVISLQACCELCLSFASTIDHMYPKCPYVLTGLAFLS